VYLAILLCVERLHAVPFHFLLRDLTFLLLCSFAHSSVTSLCPWECISKSTTRSACFSFQGYCTSAARPSKCMWIPLWITLAAEVEEMEVAEMATEQTMAVAVIARAAGTTRHAAGDEYDYKKSRGNGRFCFALHPILPYAPLTS